MCVRAPVYATGRHRKAMIWTERTEYEDRPKRSRTRAIAKRCVTCAAALSRARTQVPSRHRKMKIAIEPVNQANQTKPHSLYCNINATTTAPSESICCGFRVVFRLLADWSVWRDTFVFSSVCCVAFTPLQSVRVRARSRSVRNPIHARIETK